MKNKQKLILGVIAALVLVGFMGVYSFTQPTGNLTLNNQSTNQGISSQSGIFGGLFGSESPGGSNQGSGSGDSGGTNPNPEVKMKDCPQCGGTGTIKENRIQTCSHCQGTGIEPNSVVLPGQDPIKCTVCGGTKVQGFKKVDVTCPTCQGNKKVPA